MPKASKVTKQTIINELPSAPGPAKRVFQDDVRDAEEANLTMNISFAPNVGKALSKCGFSMGLPSNQDVVRIAVATFLKREGYLNS